MFSWTLYNCSGDHIAQHKGDHIAAEKTHMYMMIKSNGCMKDLKKTLIYGLQLKPYLKEKY